MKFLKKIFCFLGIHNYITVVEIYDAYEVCTKCYHKKILNL